MDEEPVRISKAFANGLDSGQREEDKEGNETGITARFDFLHFICKRALIKECANVV